MINYQKYALSYANYSRKIAYGNYNLPYNLKLHFLITMDAFDWLKSGFSAHSTILKVSNTKLVATIKFIYSFIYSIQISPPPYTSALYNHYFLFLIYFVYKQNFFIKLCILV